ncbi:hypothetical protein MXB_4929 [Myxobolus squamalis]|nr:hypothetical protein MXB_4929 [Myxobolus squamalis]
MVLDVEDEADFSAAIESIEHIIYQIDNIGTITSNFQPNSLSVLTHNINGMIENIRKLNDLSFSFTETRIPYDVLTLVDRGRNPELYMGNFVKDAFKTNEKLKAKINIFKYFRNHLLNSIKTELPETYLIYRHIKYHSSDENGEFTENCSNNLI